MEGRKWIQGRSRLNFLMFVVISVVVVLVNVTTTQARSFTRSSSFPTRNNGTDQSKISPSSNRTSSSILRGKASIPASSSSSSLPSKSIGAFVNSTRSIRQIPEIPALYSAPEIQTPEIPALYSAPKINPDSENELDSQEETIKATTEITVGEEEDEESSDDETEERNDYTEEPYQQYGVPTEKNSAPNDEANQEEESFNEYPTESFPPATSRTNEIDQEDGDHDDPNSTTEEDSYSSGHNEKEPRTQYGPPASSSPQGGYSKPPENDKNSNSNRNNNNNNRRKLMRKIKSNNRRPSDQQQIENSLEPMTTQISRNNEESGEPQGLYLPPVVAQPQQQPQSEPQHQESAYGEKFNQYEQEPPPNPNYRTLPQEEYEGGQNQNEVANENDNSRYRSSSRNDGGDGSKARPQNQIEQQERSDFLQPQVSHHQGQNFGRDGGPSVVYGPPPGVNHFHSGSQHQEQEEELEGLNENIVDAELLHRVQQIIEDHERQQKDFLDKIQKDNEKAFPSSSPPSSSSYSHEASGYSPSSSFPGNVLNSQTNGFSGYGSDFHGESRTSSSPPPYTHYGPPKSSSDSDPFSNGHQNPNRFQAKNGNSQNNVPSSSSSSSQPYSNHSPAGDRVPSVRNSFAGISSHHQPGGNNNSQNELRDNNSSPVEVEYQKAILSTHFTETQPDVVGSNNAPGYQQNQLNDVSGPGSEYLPPPISPSHGNSVGQQQRQQDGRHSQNAQNPHSFPSDGNQDSSQDPNSYSVKVGTGIKFGGENGQSLQSSSAPSSSYGPPAKISSPSQSLSERGEFHARQPGSPSISPVYTGEMERFPFPISPSTSQNQLTSPENGSGFWSRNQEPFQPKSIYGPPSTSPQQHQSFLPRDNEVTRNTPGNAVEGMKGTNNQITYSNGVPINAPDGDYSKSNNDNFQRSHNFEQNPPAFYLPPTQQRQQHEQLSPQQQQNFPPKAVMVAIPRPVYGVPLAPVISLDSNGNLPSPFNDPIDRGQEQNALQVQSYSPGDIKPSTASQPTSNYLPPTKYYTGNTNSGGVGHDNSLNLTPSQGAPYSYGMIFDNNPSSSLPASSPSPYHNIQGQPSNGISDAFTLPIYDYSPPQNMDELLSVGASTSQVVLPFQQFLEQLPNLDGNFGLISPSSASSAFIYGSSNNKRSASTTSSTAPGVFRVSRRALSKTASISPGTTTSNQKTTSVFQGRGSQAH